MISFKDDVKSNKKRCLRPKDIETSVIKKNPMVNDRVLYLFVVISFNVSNKLYAFSIFKDITIPACLISFVLINTL